MALPFITNYFYDSDCECDDIDFGIDKQDIDNKYNVEPEKKNPFFVGLKGGNLKDYNWGDIYRSYNNVVVITSDINNNTTLHNLFKEHINKNDLQQIKDITFFRTTLNIIKNKDNYNKINVIEKEYLISLFPHDYFNETELVLCMFDMDKENTKKYFDMYNKELTLDEVSKDLSIFNYYLGDKKNISSYNYRYLIDNIKACDFWTQKDILNLNITESFVNREFNNQRVNQDNFIVINSRKQQTNTDEKDINLNTESNKTIKTIKIGRINYPNGDGDNDNNINDQELKKKYVDPNIILKKLKTEHKNKFYNIIPDERFNNEYINNMYNLITDDKMKYMFIHNLLVSREYCHLVINNSILLEKIKPMVNKYKHVFKYTIGYTWLTMYLEECVIRTKTTEKMRFVFDINTASKLPIFPFTYDDLKQNPYITLLINDAEILQQNTFGFSFRENYDGYGVCDLETFKKRFNIFTTGDINCDPLKNLDWSKYAVSGSAISACLQKRSLLLDALVKKNNNDENLGFKSYIDKYYGKSDIDLMSNEQSPIKFLNDVNTVYDLLKINLNATDQDRSYECVKTFAVSITEHFFTDYLDDFNKTFNLKLTSLEFENMSDSILLKLYIYNKYVSVKNIYVQRITGTKDFNINNKFIDEYIVPYNYQDMNIYKVSSDKYDNYNVNDGDIVFYRNDLKKQDTPKYSSQDNKIVIKFSDNIRIKLKCKNTLIEMFRTREKEFFSTVSRFHFPCVRAYYKGNNVYMLPSCISSMMTGLNTEYKYFAGIRNPNDIINKYTQRGYGVVLNKYELNTWIKYNNNDNGLVGVKTLSNKMFNLDIEDKQKNYTLQDLENYYKNINSCVNPLLVTTINKEGNINKYIQSYVELCFDELNR